MTDVPVPDDVPCSRCNTMLGHQKVKTPVYVDEERTDGTTVRHFVRYDESWEPRDCPRCTGAY